MPKIEIQRSCPVFDSFRVQQVAGMFDVPISERSEVKFQAEVPELGNDWKIGLIVGPSGSGKTTIAKELFGAQLYEQEPWPADRAVVDCLGDRPIKEITGLLTAVGFSSPPSWIKPYHVLSNGEKFRCDLARALALASNSKTNRIVAFDEFTSVVDRHVAKIGSAAIAKGIHEDKVSCRLVAVTCHYDVTEWLQPDWVVDMATSTFNWRCLQRPKIELKLFRCKRSAWKMFARHHYLSGSLSLAARCFIAIWNNTPVAFCATLSLIGHKNRWRISRLVTLPDFQGVGIGMRMIKTVADVHKTEGHRLNVTASHPALIAHCRRSPYWRAVNVKKTGAKNAQKFIKGYRGSGGRAVVSFEYLGAAHSN